MLTVTSPIRAKIEIGMQDAWRFDLLHEGSRALTQPTDEHIKELGTAKTQCKQCSISKARRKDRKQIIEKQIRELGN